jgi:hypothetical protein
MNAFIFTTSSAREANVLCNSDDIRFVTGFGAGKFRRTLSACEVKNAGG